MSAPQEWRRNSSSMDLAWFLKRRDNPRRRRATTVRIRLYPPEKRVPNKHLMDSWVPPDQAIARAENRALTMIVPERQDAILERVHAELRELLAEEVIEFRPMPYAFTRATDLLTRVGEQMPKGFPFGYPYGDGEGGIRIEWENKSRQVRFRVPPDENGREYVYHQEGQAYAVEEPATVDGLVKWLRWLSNA